MKKQIYSIIAVAMAVTVWHAMPAFAAKIDVGGELRARAYTIQSQDFTKTGDTNWLDARFRLDAKIQQGMTTGVVQVDLLNNNINQAANNGNLVLGNSLGNSYALVGVRQAYLAINFPVLTVIGGRYEVKLGNGLILNDTSDLVAINVPVGPVNLLLGYLIIGENDAPVAAANPGFNTAAPASLKDDTAFAVNAGMKNLGGSGIDANIFVVLADLPSATTVAKDDSKLTVIGLTGAGKVGPANVNAELDLLSGTATKVAGSGADSDFKGTNLLLSGGLPAGSVGLPVGLNAAILYASGVSATSKDTSINAIDGDFRASNILVRNDFNNYEGVSTLDVTGQGAGLQAIKVAAALPTMKYGHASHTPEIGLVWAKTSEDVQVTPTKKSSDLGIEIYANTNCVFDPNLSGNIGLAYVAAGDALGQDDGDGNFVSPENQVKLEASLTFHF